MSVTLWIPDKDGGDTKAAEDGVKRVRLSDGRTILIPYFAHALSQGDSVRIAQYSSGKRRIVTDYCWLIDNRMSKCSLYMFDKEPTARLRNEREQTDDPEANCDDDEHEVCDIEERDHSEVPQHLTCVRPNNPTTGRMNGKNRNESMGCEFDAACLITQLKIAALGLEQGSEDVAVTRKTKHR